MEEMEINQITGEILDVAYKIYTDLGPGLFESVYESLLENALKKRDFQVKRQYPIQFVYDGIVVEQGFRVDLFVEDKVVIELKSVETLQPIHKKQVLTYLRIMKLPLGILINFGADSFKGAFKRIINTHSSTKIKFQPLPEKNEITENL